jgi:3-deoxy-D-manno-octulosonate 8-phosphate phosphatase (KDO 8-P phosphatase)
MNRLLEKAKAIKLLICDLDGVLTDGSLYYDAHGECMKRFHVHDGMGLKLLMLAGIEVAIITAATTPIVDVRMQALGIQHVFTGQFSKTQSYEQLLQKLNLTPNQVAYIGDDLPDLALIQRSGLGVTVENANPFMKDHADWITTYPGGNGAVRELCDLILEAQNLRERALTAYTGGA